MMTDDPKFQIFRAKDSYPCTLMEFDGPPPPSDADRKNMKSSVVDTGHEISVLFETPFMSLIKGWFKSEYPLPRHTHDTDCIYYITAGSLFLGTEELCAGDGFFVAANVPYTYTPGPQGLEIIELRPTNKFNIKIMGDLQKTAQRNAEIINKRQEIWKHEINPSLK